MKWKITSLISKVSSKERREEIFDIILSNRKIGEAERNAFLAPVHPSKISLTDVNVNALHAQRAITLVKRRAGQDNPIVIYGDYDADGITATAILWETLYRSGIKAMPFIPSRMAHGYGLSVLGLKEVIATYHPSLVITVDNGVTALEETAFAKQQGIDVIVVDHHETTGKEHPATALLHTKEVAGSGLSWIFSKELVKHLRLKNNPEKTIELAAIGTVADLVPLTGASRSIVKYGIDALRKTSRVGIQSLTEIAGIKQRDIETYHIGFQIAPRLNAMGRLETAIDSLRLLCTSDGAKAKTLAKQLNDTNRLRQGMTEEMTELARTLAKKQKHASAIVLSHEGFHEGIIGLVAGKIAQEFWRPTIVLSKGKAMSKASGRSIPGFNLIASLRECGDVFNSVGGHTAAAGFTIQNEQLEGFKILFNALAKKLLTEELLTPTLTLDTQIELSDITENLIGMIGSLQPFGIGNPHPVFATNNVRVKNTRAVGADGKHLKLVVEKDGIEFSAIGFNLGSRINDLQSTSSISIAYTPELSTWNGNTNMQLKLKDISFLKDSP